MSTGLKKNILDFEIIPSGNTKTMIFVDASEYMELHPERPLLEITPPGYAKYFLVNIVAKKVNVLNSALIGIHPQVKKIDESNCEILPLGTTYLTDLPDGVWTLKYKICPYDKVYIQKYHLRTVALECVLRQIYAYMQFEDCDVQKEEKLKKDIIDILLMIEGGKAAAEEGVVKKASTLYGKATKSINKILDRLSGKCSNGVCSV